MMLAGTTFAFPRPLATTLGPASTHGVAPASRTSDTPHAIAEATALGAAVPGRRSHQDIAAFVAGLTPGIKVRVELDAGPTDQYGRSLVYLYRAQDGKFVNAELVKLGLARRMRVSPNVKYDDLFV